MVIRILRNIKRRIFRKKIGFVHLTLKGEIVAFNEPRGMIERQFYNKKLTLLELRQNFLRLLRDPRTKGLVVQISEFTTGGLADLYELQALLKLWREHNKPVIVYSNNFSLASYFVASVADRVFINNGGFFGPIGLQLEIRFYKQFLKEHGIEVESIQVSPFKSAANFLTCDEMPEEQSEMMNWLLESMVSEMVKRIAENRSLAVDDVWNMINSSPLSAQQAVAHGWVDGVLDHNDVVRELKNEMEKFHMTDYFRSLSALPIPRQSGDKIAFIPVIGSIVDGESKDRPIKIPLLGGREAGDVTVVQTIRGVKKRWKKFKAAVLYVDSGGGSAVSSESMLAAMRELGSLMPVYAYFQNVAASGGYYIAMASRKIFATPGTITASIGVLNAKFITREFYEKKGIKTYEFKRGENADIMAGSRHWTEVQRAKLEELIQYIYDLFLDHVSKNRNMDRDELLKIAGGRVYTAAQGVKLGLIDSVQGIDGMLQEISKELDLKKPVPVVMGRPKRTIIPEPDLGTVLMGLNKTPLMISYLDINVKY